MSSNSNLFSKILEVIFESQIGKVVVIAFLILMGIVILALPPFAIPDRLLSIGYFYIDRHEGGTVKDPDGTQIYFPPEGVERSFKVKLDAEPRALFLEGAAGSSLLPAAENIPRNLIVKSPYYNIQRKGTAPNKAIITLPIPNESEPYQTLDLYTWNGESWEWLPHQKRLNDDVIESELDFLPNSVVVMQTHAIPPTVSTDYTINNTIPDEIQELNPQGLLLDNQGAIIDNLGLLPPDIQNAGTYTIIPTIRNWGDDGSVRSDLVDNLLLDPDSTQYHIEEIVNLIERNGYHGIDIDYRGASPELRDEFTAFLAQLREAMPAGTQLSVRVSLPQPISADTWETGAYDWQAIGRIANTVKIPPYTDPRAYAPGGQMEQMLNWAVSQINRYQIRLVLPTTSIEQVDGMTHAISDQQAMDPIGAATIKGGSNIVPPGQEVDFTLQGAAASTGIQFDGNSGTYWYAYLDDQNLQHTIYLENAASIARKLKLVADYHLGGVAVENPGNNNNAYVWDMVGKFLNMILPPVEGQYSVIWRIQNQEGGVIAEQAVDFNNPNYKWTAPEAGGSYTVGAVIASGDGATSGISRGEVAVLVATPTPTPSPTPLPTATPTPEPVTPTPEPKAAPQQAAPAAAAPAAPAVQSSVGNLPFDYGIQVDPGNHKNNAGMINNMGFRWVKLQMPWKYVEPSPGAYQWDTWDEIINSYASNGIKVMLSIPKSPDWARPAGTDLSVEGPPSDPNTYAVFVGMVANRYKGKVQAIEVWNEQNIDYEWGREPFDPARYMELLKASYTAIKSVNPDMIVVSGAPTPTGAPPPAAYNDQDYLRAMYAHGLKDYSDAIGAHPSGFANPPDALWQGGDFDPSRGYDDHPSFFFRNTMEIYHQIMVENGDGGKTIWPTEFGWPVMRYDDGRFPFAAENSLDRQAQWTVQAYQLGQQWGYVGTMFLWNLDYNATAGGTELANFGIVGAPAYDALANMPK